MKHNKVKFGKTTYNGIKVLSDSGNTITFSTTNNRIYEAKWGYDGSGAKIWSVTISSLDPLRNDPADKMRLWVEFFPRENDNHEMWAFFASSVN